MLSPTAKLAFREELADFCSLAESYERRWSYSQARPFTGLGAAPQSWHHDDCSAYVSLAFYWAGRHTGHSIADPLGEHYSGWGNTGSAHSFLKFNAPVDKYRIGDVAMFLEREPQHHHMMVCRKQGDGRSALWSSFGQESGPEPHELHYRSDLTGVYRHSALR